MAEIDQSERFNCPLDGVDTLLVGPKEENSGNDRRSGRQNATKRALHSIAA